MLNENMKAIRKAKGLSQQELAIKLNVVRQTISKWEQGRSHLEQLAGRILEHKPCNAQLLAILSYSLLLPRATRLTARRLDEAVALSREDHDMGVVDESANERDDEPVVPKDCVPLDELKVK